MLLRLLRRQALPEPYLQFMLGKFGQHRALLNDSELFIRSADLEDLITLLQSQRQYKHLMDLYFPVDESSNKDYARKAARRVGLEIPQ